MDKIAELIDELSELRRFKFDLLIVLVNREYSRKVVKYDDENLGFIFDKMSEIVRENSELKDRIARYLQDKK